MIFTGATRRTRTVSGSLGRWNPATRSRRRLYRESSGPADTAAPDMGRRLARWTLDHYFQPVHKHKER
jgi:hypothetical protein